MIWPERPDPIGHYDQITDAWRYLLGEDLHYGYFEDPAMSLDEATQALTRLMAEQGAMGPGMDVLDIGCGTGHPALYLARRHGCRVLGISNSRVCVERAQSRAAASEVRDMLRFAVRDGMATGLEGRSFDRVWVMESSHLMSRKDLLLAESARLLRPGGKLVLCDEVLLRSIPFLELLRIREEFLVIEQAFGRATVRELAEYARTAESVGLKVEVQLDISRQVLPSISYWKRNAEVHAAVVEGLIGPAALQRFRAACDVLSRFWLDRLGYGLLVAERLG